MTREEWQALGRAPVARCKHGNDARYCFWCEADRKEDGGEA